MKIFIPYLSLASSSCDSVFIDRSGTFRDFIWAFTSFWQSLNGAHCTFEEFWKLDPHEPPTNVQ